MKRWLVAGAIFIGTMFLLLMLNILLVFMLSKPTEQASGPIGLVVSRESLTVLFVVTVLVASFAVWLSGKLVRRASQKRS